MGLRPGQLAPAVGAIVGALALEAFSEPFSWAARVATGTLVLAGLVRARPWRSAGAAERSRPPLRAVVSGATVAVLVGTVELVALEHHPRSSWPTISSLTEALVGHGALGTVELGRTALALGWGVLGWWLVHP